MPDHWAVLFFDRHLERSDAIFHEYGGRGVTACGRGFFLSPVNYGNNLEAKHAIWVKRTNAVKFATQCKRCAKARVDA